VFVDRFFGGEGVPQPVFVLTHCHTDHLSGLSPNWRSISSQKIICTEETRRVMAVKLRPAGGGLFWGVKPGVWLRRGPESARLVPSGPVADGDHPPNQDLTFTLRLALLPTDHCVGSCMVLVETRDPATGLVTRQLHTGDVARGPLTDSTVALVRGRGLVLDRLWFDSSGMNPRVGQLADDEALACVLRLIRRCPVAPARMLWKTFGDEKIFVMAARELGALPIGVTDPFALQVLEAAYGPGVFLDATTPRLALVGAREMRELAKKAGDSTLLQVRHRTDSPGEPASARGVWRIAWTYHASWNDLLWLVRELPHKESAPFESRCNRWLALFRKGNVKGEVGGQAAVVVEVDDEPDVGSFLRPAEIPGRILEKQQEGVAVKRPRLEGLAELMGVNLLFFRFREEGLFDVGS
jgi:hypothetical protein